MIDIEITYSQKMLKTCLQTTLRNLGFTQFTGTIQWYEDFESNSTVYRFYPTISDLLTKQFKTNHKYHWQECREILFRRFQAD